MKGSWFVMAVTLTVVGARRGPRTVVGVSVWCSGYGDAGESGRVPAGRGRVPVHGPPTRSGGRGRQRHAGAGWHVGRARALLGRRARECGQRPRFRRWTQFQQSVTGAQRQTLPTKDNQPLPMPVADAAIGLWSGIPARRHERGRSRRAGERGLHPGRHPERPERDGSQRVPQVRLRRARGASSRSRSSSPASSVTYLKRDLPASDPRGRVGLHHVHGIQRQHRHDGVATGGEQDFIVFGLAAGVGQDKYGQSADVQATVLGQTSPTVSLSQDVTRTNMFADLSLNLPILTSSAKWARCRVAR